MLRNYLTVNNRDTPAIDSNAIPKHVAIIMDGNGRLGKKRNMPRIKGHYEGMQTVKKITKFASNWESNI